MHFLVDCLCKQSNTRGLIILCLVSAGTAAAAQILLLLGTYPYIQICETGKVKITKSVVFKIADASVPRPIIQKKLPIMHDCRLGCREGQPNPEKDETSQCSETATTLDAMADFSFPAQRKRPWEL